MKKRLGVVILTALLGSACSGISVNQDFNPAVNFSSLQTWDWMEMESGATGVENALTDQRVRAAVEAGLQGKGLRKAGSGDPDFRVAYRIVTEDRVTYETVHDYWGPGWGYRGIYGTGTTSSRTYAREYTMGTLLIGFFDVDAHELVWIGSAEAKVDQTRDPEQRQKRIQEAVDKVLAQFPPRR
jgi:hypothetical protein